MAIQGADSQTWIDFDGEKSTVRFTVLERTAVNFDAQSGLAAAMHIAVAGLVRGTLAKNVYAIEDTQLGVPPTDPLAQRENKWLVQYHDAVTGGKYSLEIPTADLELLDPEDRKHAQIGDAGPVDAFVAAFEAYARSPYDPTHAVVLDEITFVGRRL